VIATGVAVSAAVGHPSTQRLAAIDYQRG